MLKLANFIVSPFFKDGETVPKRTALKLIQNHRDTGGWAGGQTRGVWFSKDDFIEILGMIAALECDGMRIYIGKYPDTEILPGTPNPAKYKNRLTVVFVPTKNKENIFDIQGLIPDPLMEEPNPAFNHGDLEP